MDKQTAVEWLIDKLSNIKAEDFNSTLEVRLICQQAKAMEKEQIIKAVYDSMGTNFDPNMGRAELYYNEKYGK